MNELAHQSLVFGGSGVAGRAVCRVLQREGCEVTATCQTRASLNSMSDTDRNIVCEINDAASVQQLIEQLNSFDSMIYAIGSFDGLSHATDDGMAWYQLDEVEPEMLEHTLAVNTKGVITACRAVVPSLKNNGGGNIILLGTLNGLKLVPSPVHLAAAKAALLGIVQALAKELGKFNIRINLIVPGIINGPNLDKLPASHKETYLQHTALRRFAEPAEIAEFIGWFALHNSYATGQAIILDGGL